MADERVVHSMKIVDPTTTSQIAGVASLTDNFANPVALAVGAFNMVWDGANWDRAPGTSTDGILVNLGANNDVDTELPAAASLADDTANPTAPAVGAFLMGWDPTDGNWDRVQVGNDTGRLQVDVVTGGGSTTPSSPVTEITNSTNTAAGTSANLDTSDLAGTTKELWQVTIAASVAWKAVIGAYENGVLVENYVTLFGQAGECEIWRPSHPDFANEAFSSNAGFDGFRAVVTNLDTSEAADLYASFEYADA